MFELEFVEAVLMPLFILLQKKTQVILAHFNAILIVRTREFKQLVVVGPRTLLLQAFHKRGHFSLNHVKHGLQLVPQLTHAAHFPVGVGKGVLSCWIIEGWPRWHRFSQEAHIWILLQGRVIGILDAIISLLFRPLWTSLFSFFIETVAHFFIYFYLINKSLFF